jgi:hypothetical protein
MSRSQAALVSTTIRRPRSIETCRFEGPGAASAGRADVRDVGFSSTGLEASVPLTHVACALRRGRLTGKIALKFNE